MTVPVDRFAAMGQPGPCPTCRTSAGRPTYRPDDAKALPPEVIQRHLQFADERGPNSQ